MRPARVGHVLLAIGALVGVAASVGLLVGFEPAQLPPALLNIAAYKLTFIAAFGLIAGGAVIVRYGRRDKSIQPGRRTPAAEVRELMAGRYPESAPSAPSERRESERARSLRGVDRDGR